MLYARDCTHLTARDWTNIAGKLLHLEQGEKLLVAVSDEHAGGITSCMNQVKPVIEGFAAHADILLLNGDNFEYESPAAFQPKILELQTQFPDKKARNSKQYQHALQQAAEETLHQKVDEDIAALNALIREKPARKIIKVIGNHENFKTFRKKLATLEKKNPNFQWASELAIIPMPGDNTETKKDRLLATHGDLQMDDLWWVEPGGTDKERERFKHQDMAKKVIRTIIPEWWKFWTPAAAKQEKAQGFVSWWREARTTANALYTELSFRATEGDFHAAVNKNQLDMEALETEKAKLKEQKKEFKTLRKAIEQRTDMTEEQRKAEIKIYKRAMRKMGKHLETLKKQMDALSKKSKAFFPQNFISPKTILHYKELGEAGPKLFTSDVLKDITHINYGHTHVSEEGTEIKGVDNTSITVSNNASVTGAIMQQPLSADGHPRALAKGETAFTDLANLGILLYHIKDGKITNITTAGRLIREHLDQVKHLMQEAQPLSPPQSPPTLRPFVERIEDNTPRRAAR